MKTRLARINFYQYCYYYFVVWLALLRFEHYAVADSHRHCAIRPSESRLLRKEGASNRLLHAWPRRGGAAVDDDNHEQNNAKVATSSSFSDFDEPEVAARPSVTGIKPFHPYNPLRMYATCMGIVLLWITTGTLFYSYCNNWPLAQSFFYAIDAGMSIGFCTQVYEIKLVSKAFTIIYILLGASVVGGALALFIQDAMEGLATPSIREYKVLLEQDVFDKADVDRTGVLNFEQFYRLVQKSTQGTNIGDEEIHQLYQKFDRLQDRVIHFQEYVGTYRSIDRLVRSLREQQLQQRTRNHPVRRLMAQIKLHLQHAFQREHRIYVVFIVWISTGILWGMLDQGWDPITATHFAVSALATGGLTAPSVNEAGILPADPAIFCGIFCLFGIPLMALTLGHFAQMLVANHVAALERAAMSRPMTPEEYEMAAHLTTAQDDVVHLSDFIVLQLLRQGKLSIDAANVLKRNFDMLDTDRNGMLTLQQAMRPPVMATAYHTSDSATADNSSGGIGTKHTKTS